MEFQVKLKKAAEVTYLEARRLEARYHLKYLEVLKLKEGTIHVFKAKTQHQW